MTETSPRERLWGWIGPLAVAALALGVRMWHLGRPRTLSFDETYYAKQAWSMLKDGYAQDYVEGADKRIAAGNLADLFISGQPTQIVHPEAGKWLIALGEAAFGMDSFGWRISAAVVGALTVLVLARLVRRLTGSTIIGCLAGLLLALDGVHLVMSRLALLDGFLTFWIVCAVACLVADHDYMSTRLAPPPPVPAVAAARRRVLRHGMRHEVERRLRARRLRPRGGRVGGRGPPTVSPQVRPPPHDSRAGR